MATTAVVTTSPPEPQSTRARQTWPDIFGVYEPDAPPPPEPEPETARVNYNYLLKGLFASDTSSWAIVADGGGEYLLRKGDELPGGAIVEDINDQGVWLQTTQGRELIAFED